jgi:prepilin-type N-terminal cleavage/methylation domain-containing protein
VSTEAAADLSAEAGYSLIELLIVMTILSVVLGGVSILFTSGQKSETELNNRFQSQQGARNAVDLVRRDGHRACNVTSASGTSITFVYWDAAASPPACSGTNVTWCTRASGTKWALYRVSAAACGASGGTRYVDSITASSVFTFTAGVGTVGGAVNQHTLAVLKLDIPVNVTPNPLNQYRLIDDVALRNTVRA